MPKACIKQDLYELNNTDETLYFNNINIKNVSSQNIRESLVQKRICKIKYNGIDISERIWESLFHCTKEASLLVIQWKILHNIYPNGTYLKKCKIENSDLCKQCNARDAPLVYAANEN
ncbi:unnamed protein product [Owenia fusiformis]|uniref:Uncharacterized protein n=1 Tax=Owenia fusiformis TaxID=6347 RepID=A0A8J1U378_OWEFU|nr:unnamed protein product [Owenia fusiformis]